MTEQQLRDLKDLEEQATPGPDDARWVYGTMPAHVCKFAVVSVSKGVETIRCWTAEDARFHAAARNAIRPLVDEVLALRADKARLEFVLATLNGMQLFGEWCEKWHPTLSTSKECATDAEWRKAIDAARGKQ